MSKDRTDCDPARAKTHDRAVRRWENEGGTLENGHQQLENTVTGQTGTVEEAHLRVRLIALENVVVALLAGAPECQSDLVREMAAYISPRKGSTPHRMTTEAAHHMLALAERATHYKQDRAGG